MKKDINIPTPTQKELEFWLKEWDKMENYRYQENALNKLFHQTYPKNTDLSEILVKVATLNDFYSTNIFNIFAVARHIQDIKNIDERPQNGNESLVNEIANLRINGKDKHFYSFATKFCSHHNNKDFAIYDRFVEKILMYFKGNFKSTHFTKADDLKDYVKFKKILCDFGVHYKLSANLKDLDKYLWQLGRKYFMRYGKES